ncbi:MAG: C10 family peptidase [Prevotellaceae bacterium]|jgi:hypothetical protein|nr:C10 family peptidase [Prevotellaceae bacterium]
MKKTLLLLLALFTLTLSSWAAQRTPQDAEAIARAFFAQSPQTTTRGATDNRLRLVALSGDLLTPSGTASTRGTSTADNTAFYIYNYANTGYVIVSGDDRMKPVLGYSYSGEFVTEQLPDNILAWLQLYDALYEGIVSGARKQTPQAWTAPSAAAASLPSTVEPLLGGINYNQDAPYWNDCPTVNGGRSYVGCVATAMAMIMKYYEYPVTGTGTHSYTHNGAEYSFDYAATTFDWANMLPQYYPGQYTDIEAKAVSTLMYACAVSVDMNFSPTGSGAQSNKVAQAAVDHFGYGESMKYLIRTYFTSTEWMELIKTELNEGRPIYYSGASTEVGHAFVFDGYDAQDMVHVNWGWGGSNNGYFEVSSLDPDNPGIGGGTSAGGGFTMQQDMVIGWQPLSADATYTSYFMLDSIGVSKPTVAKGEPFEVTAYQIYNMSTTFNTGQLGVIAKVNNEQVLLGSVAIDSPVLNYYGWSKVTLTGVAIPATITDGTYDVYLATKEARESTWSAVRGIAGYEAWLKMTVAGEQCTLTTSSGVFQLKDMAGNIEVLHNLYGGKRGDFMMTLTNSNPTREFYGLAGVAFLTLPTETTESDFVALVGYSQLEIKPGTTRELRVSGILETNLTDLRTNIAPGDYYIVPGVEFGPYIYTLADEGSVQQVTVERAFGSPTLNLTNARLEKDRIEVGEKLKVMADLSLSGLGNVYTEDIVAAVFPAAGGTSNNLHYASVFVEKGVPYTLEMEFDPNEQEGDYFVGIYKLGTNGQYTPFDDRLYFTIGTSTGIADDTAADSGIRLYKESRSLRIAAGQEIQQIRIYTLEGTPVYTATPAAATVTLSTEGWSRGIYLIEVQTADGVWKRQKFVN